MGIPQVDLISIDSDIQLQLLIRAIMPYYTGVKPKDYFTNVVIKLCHVQHSVRWKLMDDGSSVL